MRWGTGTCPGGALVVIEPIRDVFAALFFFAIGLVIDPAYLLQVHPPV